MRHAVIVDIVRIEISEGPAMNVPPGISVFCRSTAAATWRADGHRLRLTGHSDVLDEAVRTLGLTLDDLTAEGGAG